MSLSVNDLAWTDRNSKDFSGREITEFEPGDLVNDDESKEILSLQLNRNRIAHLPCSILKFSCLISLDLSNNGLCSITEEFGLLTTLQTLTIKNNSMDDDSLPKNFDQLQSLTCINLSGNRLRHFPPQLIHMPNIKKLYLASNRIEWIPETVQQLERLEVLNLGDNQLETIPAELGTLNLLMSLNLANNRLRVIPQSFIRLRNLKSLSLHNNRLSTLPPELVALDLVELSLRNNPLVVRFVNDMTFIVPSLLELSGRVMKLSNIPFLSNGLPPHLVQYLSSANKCVNPRCKGVFFSARVEHVKFVDFCGKYRLPLLQYLCSPNCSDDNPLIEGSSDSESDDELVVARQRIKRVLLG